MHSPASIILSLIFALSFVFTASLPTTVSAAAIAIPMTNSDGVKLLGRQVMAKQICCSDGCKTCGWTACSTKTCLDHSLFTTCCVVVASGKRDVDSGKQYINTKGEVIEFAGSLAGEENEDQVESEVTHRINWKKWTVAGEKGEGGNSEDGIQDEAEISHRINWKKSSAAREENEVDNSGSEENVSHRINWKKWTEVGDWNKAGSNESEGHDDGEVSHRINF